MSENKVESKQEIIEKYWGKWDFINPRWPLFLLVLESILVIVLSRFVDDSGFRITDDIVLKRAATSISDITAIDVISIILYLVLIVAILYISVFVLPNGKEHDRLRLAGIFVMTGAALKIVYSCVSHDMRYYIAIGESFKMPMITFTDLYLVGGAIAIIVIFIKRYSKQDVKEIIQTWKSVRANKKMKQ